ncbi:MAG TPA: hypothetical protein VFY84_19150, partial [Jiangellales bacterium]|nr:hypothetical protein [Jiangellales bacterium]
SLIEQVPDGNVTAVLDWVGDDLARCDAAIQVEEVGKQRGTLLASLGSLRRALAERAAAVDEPQVNAPETANPDEQDTNGNLTETPGPAETPLPDESTAHVDAADAPQAGHADAELCSVHFPLGWNSKTCYLRGDTRRPHPKVFCEHAPQGGYVRPAGR